MTPPVSTIFTDAVALKPARPERFDVAFTGVTQPCPWPKAYGGDLVAQAAVAAQRTVGDGKTLHSMHSYFMRPADIGAEVRYEVETLRNGRGYSTRQVRAFQRGKVLYACLASFAVGEQGGKGGSGGAGGSGGGYEAEFPSGIPGPETLPSAAQYLARRNGGTMTTESKAYWSEGRGFDMRHVPGPVYLAVDGSRLPQQAVWIRPFDALREVNGLTSAQRDVAALAYVCDYTILEPVLRVLGLSWADEGLVTASLDHAMWFHRPGRVDDWLLYAQQAFTAAHGRGLATGRFFASDGTHLATVVQEGMIRTLDGGNP